MRICRTIAISGVALVFAFSASKVTASGIPVFDGAAQTQGIIDMQNDLRSLAHEIQVIEGQAREYVLQGQEYATQIKEYAELVSQTAALTRARSLGQLANGIAQHNGRRYLPDGMDEFVDLGASSLKTAGAAATQYNRLQSMYGPLTAMQFDPNNSTGGLARSMDHLTRTTYGTLSASEAVYNSISDRMQGVESMLDHLDNSPDLKETSDLTARISAEQALIETERLRLQSLALQLAAAKHNEELMRLKQAKAMNVYDPTTAAAAVQ